MTHSNLTPLSLHGDRDACAGADFGVFSLSQLPQLIFFRSLLQKLVSMNRGQAQAPESQTIQAIHLTSVALTMTKSVQHLITLGIHRSDSH